LPFVANQDSDVSRFAGVSEAKDPRRCRQDLSDYVVAAAQETMDKGFWV
jgi:hypothetical protein